MTEDGVLERDRESATTREKAFQAGRAEAMEVAKTPDAIIRRYAGTRNWRLFAKECSFRMLQPMQDRHVMDFGCGEGVVSTQLARLGARVTGIDISEELIAVARRRAELDGVSDRVRLMAGDVLDMEPTPEADALLCAAVLHHVDLHEVFPHLLRFVKPGGRVVVQEPIAFSKRLQAVRNRVPVEREVSPDERQLTRDDIDFLASRLDEPRRRYFRLAGRLVRLLPDRQRTNYRHPVVYGLALIDGLALAALPPLRRYAGVLVLSGRRPSEG